MARSKQPKSKDRKPLVVDQGGRGDQAVAEASGGDHRQSEPTVCRISGKMAPWLISAAIVVHLFTLLLSYSAIIEPSATHSNLLDAASPYLRSTHFAADGRPFYLAHATPDEQPHRLQTASGGDEKTLTIDLQTKWTTIEPGGGAGLAASDRYGRWMGLVATLAQSDQPSLAASLLMPLVSGDDSIDAVRIVRFPTELTTATDDAAPPVYLARVVRGSDGVSLVSIQSKRLTTSGRQPVQGQTKP
jgi:hypothetical protein